MSAATGLSVVWATAASAADADAKTNTNTTTGSTYHPGMAVWFLAAAVLVLVFGLLFSYLYHAKLLDAMPKIMRAAGGAKISSTVSSTSDDAMTGLRAAQKPGFFAITRPDAVVKGQKATFTVVHSDGKTVTWEAAGTGGPPVPASGTGPEFEVTFNTVGPATVSAKIDGGTASVSFDVQDAAASVGGVVLPFAVRNWGRFVVTILGVGVIAALMALGIVSAEGGIGILGALLGVGAAAATADPAATPTAAGAPAGGGGSTTS